jgi:hypothetical protein
MDDAGLIDVPESEIVIYEEMPVPDREADWSLDA